MLTVLSVSACANLEPVLSVNQHAIPPQHSHSHFEMLDIEHAILQAARAQRWSAQPVKPGLIVAAYSTHNHKRAEVDIAYNLEAYSIVYKSSDGLEQAGGNIHQRYNTWVAALDHAIHQQLALLQ